MSLSPPEFEFFRGWLRSRCGIALENGKEYLVETRLDKVARSLALDSPAAVVRQLRDRPNAALESAAIEALTTNETSFFRDWRPFEALHKVVLPAAMQKRGSERRLDLWSAACSSGQEAYSLSLLMSERLPDLATWDVHIHCTDLSNEMVARTKAGRFSQLEVNRGLPAPLLVKHFRQEGTEWVVSDAHRKRVSATQLNLTGPWATLPTMDVIMLRNVLIYFDLPTRKAILDRARRLLRPGAVLFLGSAETTVGIHDGFKLEDAGGTTFFRAC
jgi:chemotaxis protein methyltransferase CheR